MLSKRITPALGLVLLGTLGAVPWLVGQHLLDGHERLLAEMRAGGIQVVEQRYRAGWFTSEAETLLILPANGSAGPRLRVSTRLQHLDLGDGSRLSSAHTLLAFPGADPFVALDSAIQPDGAVQSRLTLPADARPAGRILFHPADRGVTADIKLASLWLPAADNTRYLLQNLQVTSRSRLGAAGLRLGEFAVQLEQLSRVSPDEPQRDLLDGLRLRSGAEAENGRVTVTSHWEIAALHVGPLALQRLDALLRMNGLSAVLLARAVRVLPLFFLERPPSGGPQLALAGTLLSSFSRLLQSEPALNLERLRFASALGDLDAALNWRLTPPGGRQALDPEQWLRRLQMDGRVTAAEPLARRLAALLGDTAGDTGWVDEGLRQGLLRRRDDLLFARWRLRDGWLKVNDQILQLSQ